MSEPAQVTGEQPAHQTPIEANGEQPIAVDHSAQIRDASQEELADALFGNNTEQAPAQAPAPVATPPAPEPASGAQPDPEHAKEPEESLRRIALGGVPMTERVQMAEVARMIRTGEASTQLEALQKMGVLQAAESTSATQETAPEPSKASVSTGITEIEATIADLREQRKAAKAEFDADEEDRLDTLISQNERALIRAELQLESQQVIQQSYQEKYISAVDAMEEKHAWTTDETSPLYGLLSDRISAAQARQDPALADPNFITKFADEIASLVKPSALSKPPPPPAVQQRTVGAAIAPSYQDAHQPSEAEARQLMGNATKEQLSAALFG